MATCIQELKEIDNNWCNQRSCNELLAGVACHILEGERKAHLLPEVTLMTYQIWTYLSAGSFKGYFEQAKWVGTAAGETSGSVEKVNG